MSKYSISVVPVTLIEYLWESVEPLIQEVVDVAHGEVTTQTVKEDLLTNSLLLVTVSHGSEMVAANILDVVTFDTDMKSLFIPIIGGRDIDGWGEDFIKVAKVVAKNFGCTDLRGMPIRKGLVRKLEKFGFSPIHTVVKCEV